MNLRNLRSKLNVLILLLSLTCCDPSSQNKPISITSTGSSIEVLVDVLSQRGIPPSQIKFGRYPLIHQQAQLGSTLPLLSAPIPLDLSPTQTLQVLTPPLLEVGYELVTAEREWVPGRPLLAGVSYEGRPVLALRLSPPGPRLSIIMSPPASEEIPPRLLRRLPEHLTFAINLEESGALATYDYLSAAGRELLLHSPSTHWEHRGLTPPPNAQREQDPAARWRDLLGELIKRPYLSALYLPERALSFQPLSHLKKFAQELKSMRITLVEPIGGLAQRSKAMMIAQENRLIQITHELDPSPTRLMEELKRVEATLVLEGEAVIWVPPLNRNTWRSFTSWLTELTLHKGVCLMRISEMSL